KFVLATGSNYNVTTNGITFYNLEFTRTYYSSSNYTITLYNDFTVSNNLSLQCEMNYNGRYLIVSGSGSPTITLNGNLLFPSNSNTGEVKLQSLTVNLAGDIIMNDSDAQLSANVTFNSTSQNQTVTVSAGTISSNSWTIDKTSYGLYQGSNLTLNSTTITLTSGTLNTYDVGDVNEYNLTVNGLTVNGGTVNVGATSTLTVTTYNQSDGTFSPNSASTVTIADFTQSGGTFTSPSTLTIRGDFTYTAGTFNSPTTLVFIVDDTYWDSQIKAGGLTFNNVTFQAEDWDTRYIYQDFTVSGNLTFTNDTSNEMYIRGSGSPTVTVNGNVSIGGTGSGNTYIYNEFTLDLKGNLTMNYTNLNFYPNINFTGSSGDQTVTQTAGSFSTSSFTWTINKSLGNLVLGSNITGFATSSGGGSLTITSGVVSFGSYTWDAVKNYSQSNGTIAMPSSDFTVYGTFTLSGGTFTAPSGNLTIYSTFDATGGTFNHNSGTVTFMGNSSYSLTPGTSLTFNNLVFDKDSGSNQTITIQGDFTVAGDLTLKNRTSSSFTVSGNNSPTITVNGNLLFPSTTQAGRIYLNNTISVNLAGDLTINDAGAYMRADITFNNTSSSQTITHSAGTIDQGDWIVDKTSAILYLGNDLTLTGSTTFTITTGTFKLMDSTETTDYNVTFKDFTQNGGTLTGGSTSNMTVTGTFSLTDGTFTAPGGTLECRSTFTVSGGTF
ncbi:MAG: hypothetical protein DRP08_07400, partial [Candidatus Aenigmatarchaeota archaeon]